MSDRHLFSFDQSLSGFGMHLDRLQATDAEALRRVSRLEDFQHYLNLMPRSMEPDDFAAFIADVIAGKDRISVIARQNESGEVLACSSWMDLRPEWRCLEIGLTWIAAPWRGTWVNPALKRLMLGQAFDQWGCVRVMLKCDARNQHSQAAIAKLGAQREGVLRKYGVQPSGFIRDTVVFSILDEEWPGVRDGLDARLSRLLDAKDPIS